MADPSQEYPTELARRLAIIEDNLHFVVRMEMTREEAMSAKQRLQLPLGVLNSRFGLRSNSSNHNKTCVKQVT